MGVYKNVAECLEDYRFNYAANGVLESTVNQVVEVLDRIFRQLEEHAGVTFENGAFVGLDNASLLRWQAWMMRTNKVATTRNKYTIHINAFLKWAVNMKLVKTDREAPIYEVLHCARLPKQDQIPEDQRKQKVFSREEISRLMVEMPGNPCNAKRDRAILAVLLGSGIRASMLCEMNIGDVYAQPHGQIYVHNKGGSWRRTEIGEWAYPFIDEYIKTREDKDDMKAPLFITQQRTRYNRHSLLRLLSCKEKALGLQTGVHIFRHTFVTEAERASRSAVARDLVMHTSLTITNRYDHATDEEKADAVNGMWFNQFTPSGL